MKIWIGIPPTLESERLILRTFREVDAPEALVGWGDEEVQRYNAPVLKTVEQARDKITEILKPQAPLKEMQWAVAEKAGDRVIGGVSLHSWNFYHQRTEIGYDLRRDRWGKGLASEAVRRMIRFAFEDMGFHRIEARTVVANQESVRMLERLGFTREGTRRGFSLQDDGYFDDSALFGLLRKEWKA